MAYLNNLPLFEYPSRFVDQSSNEDYVLVRNIFRRAKLREDIANYITFFDYYLIQDDERPDQIAERLYGNPELDWVILITNNIINYPSNWTLNNDSFYQYLIDKYGSDDALKNTHHLETKEIRDEYNRLVIPEKLRVDSDIYEEFTTIANKDNPLFYDLKRYPVSNEYYPLKITSNLGEYLQVWERDNLGENEEYTGEEYQITEIYFQTKKNEQTQDNIEIGYNSIPDYAKIDYCYLYIYGRGGDEDIYKIFCPNTLNGWPHSWGGAVQLYTREQEVIRLPLDSNIGVPFDITDDYRLYSISSIETIDTFTYTSGTTLESEANQIYTLTDLPSNNDGLKSIFKITRNSLGEVVLIELIHGGRQYSPNDIITVSGSLIGGEDKTDDVLITVSSIKPKPQFKFIQVGDELRNPFPGVKVTIFNETGMRYTNTLGTIVDIYSNEQEVDNYTYEVELNENNRKIRILRPEYIGAFVAEFTDIMSYANTSETLTSRLKRTYNPKVTGN